jgi:chromosome partitioning protein
MPTERKPRVITIYLSKGGVAKSTLAALIATFLAGLGFRVVLLDLDRQGAQSEIFDLIDEHGQAEVLHAVPQAPRRHPRGADAD